jgi:hypothetical protein
MNVSQGHTICIFTLVTPSLILYIFRAIDMLTFIATNCTVIELFYSVVYPGGYTSKLCVSSPAPNKECQIMSLTGNSRSLGSQYRNFVA